MCTLSFALTVVLVSLVDTTQSQCTTNSCTGSRVSSDNCAVNTQSLVDGITEILQKADKTQKKLEALEASFNSRLSAMESKLAGDKCNNEAVTFLRRQDGSANFTRSWSEYRDGFGDPDGEFWLGLTSLHRLTSQHRYRLRVELLDWSGERKWAEYGDFGVGSESENFKLSISGYDVSSTAGDSIAGSHSLNGMAFSTYDRDNDVWSGSNCAAHWKGGWWYRACHRANPTGLYKPAGYRGLEGINWYTAYNDRRSFTALTLKMIPV